MMKTGRRQEITRLLENGRGKGQEGKAASPTVVVGGPGQTPVGRRFADLLVSDGLITQEQFDRALAEQKRTGEKLGEILVGLGLITEAQLVHFLSRHYGIPQATLHEQDVPGRI